MRTEQARPVRLENYRPPDWLVETVTLDITLHPTRSRVRSTLKLKPNPEAAAAASGFGLSLSVLWTRLRVGCSVTSSVTVSTSQSGGR